MPKTRSKNYRELSEQVLARPGAVARLAALRQETLAEIGLYELRRAQDLSQTELAERLRISQAAVSKFENSGDVRLSTLRQYVEALGGHLELSARFPDRSVRIDLAAPRSDALSKEGPPMTSLPRIKCLVRLFEPDGPARQVQTVVIPRGGSNPEVAGDVLALQAYYEAQGETIDWDTVRPDEKTWENEAGLDVRYVHGGVNRAIELVAHDKARDVHYIYGDFEATEIRAEILVLTS